MKINGSKSQHSLGTPARFSYSVDSLTRVLASHLEKQPSSMRSPDVVRRFLLSYCGMASGGLHLPAADREARLTTIESLLNNFDQQSQPTDEGRELKKRRMAEIGVVIKAIPRARRERKLVEAKRVPDETCEQISVPKVEFSYDSDGILQAVATFYGLNFDQLYSRNRRKNIIAARRAAIYLLTKDLGWKNCQISKSFNINHSLVCSHIGNLSEMLKSNSTVQKQIAAIRAHYLHGQSGSSTDCDHPRAEIVLQAVQECYGINLGQLTDARIRRTAHLKSIVVYVLREDADLSFPEIAQALDKRSHSGVHYSYNYLKQIVDGGDEQVIEDLSLVRRQISLLQAKKVNSK